MSVGNPSSSQLYDPLVQIVRPEQVWDSTLRLPRLAMERTQVALSAIWREVKGIRVQGRVARKTKEDQLRDLMQKQEFELIKQENLSLMLKLEALQNELSRLKLHSEQLEMFLKADVFRIVGSSQQKLHLFEQRQAHLIDGLNQQITRNNQSFKTLQLHDKKIFLVEQHCRNVQQTSNITKEQHQVGLKKITQHIQGGARLQRIQQKMKDNQTAIQKAQTQIFEEIKTYLQKVGKQIDVLQACKLQKSQFSNVQFARRYAEDQQRFISKIDSQFGFKLQSLENELNEMKQATNSSINFIGIDLAKLTRLLVNKPGVEHLEHLQKFKCDKSQIDILKAEIDRLQQQKVQSHEFIARMNQQREFNQAMFKQSILGKWLWNSDQTKAGFVPWDGQIVNSRPQIYLWDKGTTSIRVLCSGVYHLTAGFFTPRKPQVTVFLDGKPVQLQCSGASYAVVHSNGRVKQNKHPLGEVTGFIINDYILLGSEASISFKYEGASAEAFLMLKRL